jgi:hypothetical protein
MTPEKTPLEEALQSEVGATREALLKAAHEFGISVDDPLWLIVKAIRESDKELVERMERIERALCAAVEKLCHSEERASMSRIGYETLEARINDRLVDIHDMASQQWDRCHAGIEQGVQMKRWLVGVVILAVALWALATPRPSEKRDSIPPAEEAVQSDE